MVEGKIKSESLWAAAIGAFMLHSLALSALVLGMAHFDGVPWRASKRRAPKNDFSVQVVFMNEANKGPLPEQVPASLKMALSFTKPASKQKSDGRKRASMALSISALASSPSETSHAVPLYNPPPVYPLEARRKRAQGTVLVRLFLTPAGAVDKATVLPPRVDPVLEVAALTAVRQWRFKVGGGAIEVPIEFRLNTLHRSP
jgi:TonB family protein